MTYQQSYRWCFTLNNYDEAELVLLREGLSQEQIRYAIFGLETGEGGTPHVQGYVSFKKKKRLSATKKVVSVRAHVEVAKGSEAQNVTYCSKEGKVEEFGERSAAGARNDLNTFKAAVAEGLKDRKRLFEEHTEVCAKYPRFVTEYLCLQVPDPVIPTHPLHPWQQELNQRLIHAPDDRKVIFVVDYVGNNGKSWFAKYYMSLHDNAYLMRPTKHADMAYALPNELRVLFLDCTRQKLEFFPYTFIEELKDGYVMSSKYESCVKKYPNVHVCVLMNQMPDMTMLSDDRYDIMDLGSW